MRRSSRFVAYSAVLLLAACMKKEAPKDTTAAMAPDGLANAVTGPLIESLQQLAASYDAERTPACI